MKATILKYFLILAAIVAVITHASGCVQVKHNLTVDDLSEFFGSSRVKGNGKLVTKTLEAPEFTWVSAHRAAEVTLLEKEVKEISVTADENIMPYVVITCQRGVLKITLDDALKNVGDYTFRVTLPINPQIDQLSTSSGAEIAVQEGLVLVTEKNLQLVTSSAGEIEGSFKAAEIKIGASSGAEVKGSFHASKIEMNASSAGEIEGQVSTIELKADASSGADIDLKGEAAKSRMIASSAGSIDAEELIAQTADATASSGADIRLHCTKEIRATASSGGSIRYSGNPTSTQIVHSSGGSVSSVN